jgi:hypothetical protein
MTTATTPVTNPNVTRSRLVLEIASELAGGAAADAVPSRRCTARPAKITIAIRTMQLRTLCVIPVLSGLFSLMVPSQMD